MRLPITAQAAVAQALLNTGCLLHRQHGCQEMCIMRCPCGYSPSMLDPLMMVAPAYNDEYGWHDRARSACTISAEVLKVKAGAGSDAGIRGRAVTYTVVHVLATGCTLPVEMFFPAGEMPTAALEVALARLGVACRLLGTGADTLSGFTLKAAAILLSSFEEVTCHLSTNAPL